MVGQSVDWMVRRGIEASCDGVFVVDPEGRIRYANERMAQLLGRTIEDLLGLTVFDLLDASGVDQYRAHLAEVRERGPNDRDVECWFTTPDGGLVPLTVGESGIRDDDGVVVGYLYRLIGDEQSRELHAAVSRSRAQLADAQAIAQLGSWEIDRLRDTVSWSPQLYAILGLDPGSEPGVERFFDLLHPEDAAEVADAYERVQQYDEEHAVEARLVLEDGRTRWVRVIGRPVAWVDGVPVRIGGTVQDIDDAKATELQLRDAVELNTLMQFMATAANEAATLHDAMATLRALILAHWDWQGAVAFDVAGDELVPLTFAGEEPTEAERRVAARALAAGGVLLEERLQPENPMIAFPVHLQGDPLIVAVITARSPFERHDMLRSMAEQVADRLGTVAAREAVSLELEVARDEAMDASKAKSEFVATMSHEIRTPLNGVIGLNDLLLRTDLDEHQRRLAEGMQGAGRALLRLINDILDFSKIEAGVVDLERVPFRPREVAGGVVELFLPDASQRGVTLKVSVDPSVPAMLVGDPGRFRQILSNLVSNAVKFTDRGSVTVTLSAIRVGELVELRTEVADSGIGMEAGQVERVFDPFRQADASTTRQYGGTGLGLTIARQLAAALDGELGATSTRGVGSRFWFTARFTPTAETREELVEVANRLTASPRGHVLVVEDNETNQLVALGMLQALGCTADVAVDGAEGAERALSGDYAAVLMDLQMPGTDGLEGTRRIRAGEGAGRRLPIIALTASATDGERDRCLAAGADAFLTKPLVLERLAAELRQWLPVEERPSVVPPETGDQPVLDPGRLDELAEMGAAALPLIRRAVENFLTGAPAEVATLRAAAERNDHDSLRAGAHRLKGSAANLGLVALADVAHRLEELGRAAELDTAARSRPLLAHLEDSVDEGTRALRRHPVVVTSSATPR